MWNLIQDQPSFYCSIFTPSLNIATSFISSLRYRLGKKHNLIHLFLLARRGHPIMKRTFTHMESSPSAETPVNGAVQSEAKASTAAEGPFTMHEATPPTIVQDLSVMNEPPLSKNKLKKLKRDREWEENREKRKVRRKEKLQEKKQRKRIARENNATATETTVDAGMNDNPPKPKEAKVNKYRHGAQVPITLMIDCGFDNLMVDTERTSLCSQLTRCYSDNCKAPYRAHLAVSSFGGHLKDRFDSILSGQYRSWKGVRFFEDDFVQVASQAREWMKNDKGSKIIGALATDNESSETSLLELSNNGEVVYLTSDSPNTLTELRPYSTYVIGGIVDKNRHKGICYKRALDQKMKTAKLPIGDYMKMTSRFVLATNHVAEIMLRWLEVGEWGKAFLEVIPKRKGGILKGKAEEEDEQSGPGPLTISDIDEAAEESHVTNALPDSCSIKQSIQCNQLWKSV